MEFPHYLTFRPSFVSLSYLTTGFFSFFSHTRLELQLTLEILWILLLSKTEPHVIITAAAIYSPCYV